MMSVTLEKKHDRRLPTCILGGDLPKEEADSKHPNALVTACMDGVYTLDLESGDHEKLYAHSSYASSAHWLKDGSILSGGYDGELRWFNPNENNILRRNKVHDFWSWESTVSSNGKHFASVTGQYLAGDYKYRPRAETEPSLCIGLVESGELIHRLPHVPSVQSVAFSPHGQYVAAGNIMGEVRVYQVETGDLVAQFNTPDFTSWGIIKSHCYLGGIFSMRFTPSGDNLLLAGMGEMRDPMAGNGKQLWQKWSWRDKEPKLQDQTHKGDNGEGLMEALAIHPSGKFFAMGGRLRGGDWNVALFDMEDGRRLTKLKTGYRVTTLQFSSAGQSLVVLGGNGQKNKDNNGDYPHFGRAELYQVSVES